jgi:hypothetical protein
MASVGVGNNPPNAAAGPSRSGPMESFPSRKQTTLSPPTPMDFVRSPRISEDGDIGCCAADIQGYCVFAAPPGHGKNTHDACRRTGEDCLNGKFHGLFDVECSPVRFQDIDRDVDPPLADKTADLCNEMTVALPDGLVEIGCRDAPGEIEMSRHAMPERDMVQPVVDDLFKFVLLFGVPWRKFPDDAAMLDTGGSEMGADSRGLLWIDVFNLDASVVYIAG